MHFEFYAKSLRKCHRFVETFVGDFNFPKSRICFSSSNRTFFREKSSMLNSTSMSLLNDLGEVLQ